MWYLKAHLLGLLRIHGGHVLVVPQGVPLLLLLCTQVAPQGHQNSLSLWKGLKLSRLILTLLNWCLPHPYLPIPEADRPVRLPGNLPGLLGAGR